MASPRAAPIRVFISHSTLDLEFVEAEIVDLLRRQGLEPWISPDSIRGADEWQGRIRAGLESCEWFLVALSPHSVRSEWVRTEVHWAMENRKGKVIPVLIADCTPEDCHLMLGRVQSIDFRGRRPAARDALLSLWKAMPEGPRAARPDVPPTEEATLACPYRGLFSFREQDADAFFGRHAYTERLLGLVHREPLIALVGPSGSGKSSLLFAGLLPWLRQSGRWQVVAFRPGQRPFHALAAALVPLLAPQSTEIDRLRGRGDGNVTLLPDRRWTRLAGVRRFPGVAPFGEAVLSNGLLRDGVACRSTRA